MLLKEDVLSVLSLAVGRIRLTFLSLYFKFWDIFLMHLLYAQWKIFLELVANPSMLEKFFVLIIHRRLNYYKLDRRRYWFLVLKVAQFPYIRNCSECHNGKILPDHMTNLQ